MLVAALMVTTGIISGYSQFHSDHGVKVYKHDGAKIIDFAAEGEFDAPPEKVERVLLDYASHAKWAHGVGESQVLAEGPFSKVVYQRLKLPVLHDRDYTLLVTWGVEHDARWLRFMAANDRGPAPREGVVRVNVHEGSWRLEPIRGGAATHAIYQFRLDLAGSFPAWMGRGQAGKDLPQLFDNIRAQLQYY
jgi:Polyketide cyclase / dehydrase and lipid transport